MPPCAPSSARAVELEWRRFADLTATEADFATVCGAFWTGVQMPVHFRCMPGKTIFAVTSPTPLGRFRWAVFDVNGLELDGGWEALEADAQRVAVEAQELWSHRCKAKDKCRCAKFQR